MIRIAIPTTTRADWDLLKPVADALSAKGITPEFLVSGTHMAEEFGCTVNNMDETRYNIAARLPILDADDGILGESRTMARALELFGEYFVSKRPDAVIALGDRYEMLAIAEAAFLAHIPIFHIHGGEVTEGALDDAFRHCLTKLSVLHFASTEKYRNRIIQLGETPDRVFNVGALGVENALRVPKMGREDFVKSLGLRDLGDFVLLTYHPVTAELEDPLEGIKTVLDSLELFQGLEIIATKSNADAGGRSINGYLGNRAQKDSQLHLFDSLGSVRYLNAARYAKAVVGNSSSGILEVPAVDTPTVNIGPRQKGRIRPMSVIDCELDKASIRSALKQAMSKDFTDSYRGVPNPYGSGDASKKIADVIVRAFGDGVNTSKLFYDLDMKGEAQ